MRVLAFVQRVGTFLFALTFVLAPVNVLAQCITLGTVVNCTGSTPSPGFGDGTQNGLTINVANGATVSGGGPNWLAALELGSNNVVNNFGSVVGDRHGIFSSGVNVENSGSITGLWYGIWNSSGNYSLTNSGYIYGYVGGAIFSPSGFSMTNIITNTALGHIAGQLYGMNGDGATINNFGVISGDYIALTGDGVTITNYGTITGGGDGIQIRTAAVAGGDITNRGLIFGGTNALNLRNPANAFTVFNSGSLVGNVLLGINRLQLENGGTISGNVFNNGIFAVNRSTDYRFDGLISGTGTFQNDGSGTTTLSNISTYTGATTVNAGTLSVTGDISSSSGVTVNTGGTLSGTGNLPAVLIQSGGALVPGNSAGTITVNGSLTFNSGSTYSVEVSSTSADKTVVQGTPGTVTINGGTVAVAAQRGGARTFTIITASGLVTGAFNTLTVSGNVRNPRLTYGANDVFFSVDASLISTALPLTPSGNQRGVSNGIDNAILNGATLSNAFNTLLGLTGSALTNALTQVSGEGGAGGGRQGASQMTGSFLTLALNPFGGSSGGNIGGIGSGRGFGFAAEQELSPEAAQAYAAVTPTDRRPSSTFDRRWGIWGQAYGGLNKTSGDTGTRTHDTTSRSYGLATGADYRATADLMFGFALAGGGTNYGLSDGLGGGKSDVFQIGFYGSKQFGPAYVSAALSYAWHGMKTARTVTISGTDNLTATFNAHSFGGRLESGYKFDVPFVSITPYAALQMQQFRTPSYSETAASGSNAFALSYDAKSTTSTRTELGIWLDKMFALDRGNMLAIRTRAAWAHDHSSDQSTSAAFQALPGSSFTMNGAATVPNSALLSAGAEIRLASGVSFGAKFDGELAAGSQTYAGTGTVRSVW